MTCAPPQRDADGALRAADAIVNAVEAERSPAAADRAGQRWRTSGLKPDPGAVDTPAIPNAL